MFHAVKVFKGGPIISNVGPCSSAKRLNQCNLCLRSMRNRKPMCMYINNHIYIYYIRTIIDDDDDEEEEEDGGGSGGGFGGSGSGFGSWVMFILVVPMPMLMSLLLMKMPHFPYPFAHIGLPSVHEPHDTRASMPDDDIQRPRCAKGWIVSKTLPLSESLWFG